MKKKSIKPMSKSKPRTGTSNNKLGYSFLIFMVLLFMAANVFLYVKGHHLPLYLEAAVIIGIVFYGIFHFIRNFANALAEIKRAKARQRAVRSNIKGDQN